MILTVTPNVSIDKTYTIEGFGVDRIHRPGQCVTTPGGKGVNVVRVLKELGRDALATGFIGGKTGESIKHGLDSEGLRHDFLDIDGESRLCIKIMDPANGTQTEINEPGPVISPEDVERLIAKIKDLADGCELVALCGNCPPGVPAAFYGDIVRMMRAAGIKTLLDASGEHLAEAIKAGPYIAKPNVAELSQLVGSELYTLEEISRAAKSLRQFGTEITAVTMGRSGAVVTDGVRVWNAVPPAIEFASAVGSGDSFVAAFVDSVLRGDSLGDALAWGTAAGAANATTYGAGFCSKDSIMNMRERVTVTQID